MRKRSGFLVATGAVLLCAALWLWPSFSRTSLSSAPWELPRLDRDLDEIRQDTLRLLVVEHPLTYERLRGDETGLEFELIERFARSIGVPLRAVLVRHADSLLMHLQRGDGDLIAARLGEGNSFGRAIARSRPFRYVTPVIATLREDRVLGIASAGSPDTVWVSCGSPFTPSTRLWPGMEVDADPAGAPYTLFTDTAGNVGGPLINVALGRIRAALITDAEAAYAGERFPQMTFGEPVGQAVPLYFGLRRNSPHLRKAVDEWLADPEEKEARGMMMSVYGTRVPRRGALGRPRKLTRGSEEISPYDSLFQQHAEGIAWDWELLAAIAFKESSFDTSAVSVKGAQGLMQMMPRTAERMGADSLGLVNGQIKAAARYLATLDSIWVRSVPRRAERLRFVLAAYNAGPGHVRDAQRLAEELGLDPHKWEGSVERAITLLALPGFFTRPEVESGPCQGSQTFNYVREVTGLYEQFQSFTDVTGP